MTAVDGDHAAGHERTRLGRKQQQRAVEFLGLADAALRDAVDQLPAAGSFQKSLFISVSM